jgi:hypothetical protein
MSFKEGYDFGHGRDRRTPFEKCTDAVLAEELPEVELYHGHDTAKRGVAEEVAREFYREGEHWEEAFAGYLAAREVGIEYVSPHLEVADAFVDPRTLIKPSRISA